MEGHCHLLARCRRTDLGGTLILANCPWSSRRVYAGLQAAPGWLSRDRMQSGCWGDQGPAGGAGGAHGDADSPGRAGEPLGGIGYAAAALGGLRFWTQVEQRRGMRRFASRLQRALVGDRQARLGLLELPGSGA